MAAGHLSAIDLLKRGDEDRQKPLLNQYWPQILGVTFGVGLGAFLNFATKRPAFSGLQKHIIGVAGFTGILTFAQKKRDEYYAEKDAVFRHYIELHPEDFTTPPRVVIGDVLEPWVPIR